MIDELRVKIAENQFEFSLHAVDQSIVRHISVQEIREAFANGQMKASETFVERQVTYTIEVDGKFIIIENVPARVCLETGERFFAPETVERLQQTVWEQKEPDRVIETPVFEFAA
jgi:YgiT-type zinc finger domain-containing protein